MRSIKTGIANPKNSQRLKVRKNMTRAYQAQENAPKFPYKQKPLCARNLRNATEK
jgi:hypothetical protein